MDRRLELQTLLENVLGGSNVYFQPPATVKMAYPAIVYQRDGESADYANNNKYRRMVLYQVTVIDRNPDSAIVERVSALPMCYHAAFFVADGLNHDVFRMYF